MNHGQQKFDCSYSYTSFASTCRGVARATASDASTAFNPHVTHLLRPSHAPLPPPARYCSSADPCSTSTPCSSNAVCLFLRDGVHTYVTLYNVQPACHAHCETAAR